MEMDDDDRTIGRIFTRREALAVAGAALWEGAAWGDPPKKMPLIASPSLTEGTDRLSADPCGIMAYIFADVKTYLIYL